MDSLLSKGHIKFLMNNFEVHGDKDSYLVEKLTVLGFYRLTNDENTYYYVLTAKGHKTRQAIAQLAEFGIVSKEWE